MSDLLMTLSGGPAVGLEPVTFARWLAELQGLTLELEGSAIPYWAMELDGTFFVWTCWTLARVN